MRMLSGNGTTTTRSRTAKMHLPTRSDDFGRGDSELDSRRAGGVLLTLPLLGRRRVRLRHVALLSVFLSLVFLLGRWSSPSSSHSQSTFSNRPGVPDGSATRSSWKRPIVPARPPAPLQPPDDRQRTAGMFDRHNYHENGLLEVNPKGKHPIFELMQKAETNWNDKLRHVSATLEEAVEEYKRRYGRDPPRGFDKWWAYAQENNVQLPDEYDMINEQLKPFWGVRPIDLQEILTNWEDNSDVPVMVFGKTAGRPIRILKNGMPEADKAMFAESVRDRLNLLLDVEDDIPEFRAIISPADTPNLLTDWELKEAALEAAAKGKYINIHNPPPDKHGWLSACDPDTPARDRTYDFYAPVPRELLRKSKKTFIHDHNAAMDPCQHPAHLFTSGQFLSHYEGPSPHSVLVPQFSSSATRLHYDLLPIPPRGWGEERRDIAWEDKYDERLLWRGLNTGMLSEVGMGGRWMQSQRVRLVQMVGEVEGTVKVLPPPRAGEEDAPVGPGEAWPKARINPAMFDVAFSGSPVQCDEETCGLLTRDFEWKKHMTIQESSRYKYVIDVDGNGWSSRFKRLMASNAVVFKSTVYPEWYSDRIQPWLHYVPIALDYSDLYDTFIFFRGDLSGNRNHDDLAKRIAYAGSNWTDTFWRDEDAAAYMYRLFLEYARIMSIDRDGMSFKLSTPRGL